MVFREDDSRVRTAHNLAMVGQGSSGWALNGLKQEKSARLGVAHQLLKAAWDQKYRVKWMALMFEG